MIKQILIKVKKFIRKNEKSLLFESKICQIGRKLKKKSDQTNNNIARGRKSSLFAGFRNYTFIKKFPFCT